MYRSFPYRCTSRSVPEDGRTVPQLGVMLARGRTDDRCKKISVESLFVTL